MSIQLKAQLLDARKDPEKPQCDLPELPLVRWSDGTKPAGRFVRCNKNDQQNPQGLASYGFKVRGVVHVFDLKITQKSRNHNFFDQEFSADWWKDKKNPSTWETKESLLKTRHFHKSMGIFCSTELYRTAGRFDRYFLLARFSHRTSITSLQRRKGGCDKKLWNS